MPPDQNSVHITPLTYSCMCSLIKETDEYKEEILAVLYYIKNSILSLYLDKQ